MSREAVLDEHGFPLPTDEDEEEDYYSDEESTEEDSTEHVPTEDQLQAGVDEESAPVSSTEVTEGTLNDLTSLIDLYKEKSKSTNETVRSLFFDTQLEELSAKQGFQSEDVLLFADPVEDDKFVSFVTSTWKISKDLYEKNCNPENRPVLLEMLNTILVPLAANLMERERTEAVEETTPPQQTFNLDDLELEENNSFDEGIVRALTEDIMNIYSKLYAPGFVSKPVGILTNKGILTMNKEFKSATVVKEFREYSIALYDFLQQKSEVYLPVDTPVTSAKIKTEYFNTNGTLKQTYIPMFHLLNIYGVDDKGKKYDDYTQFSRYLRPKVQGLIRAILSNYVGNSIGVQNSIKDLFTNCIIVDELDRTKAMQFRYKVAQLPRSLGNTLHHEAKRIFSIDTGSVISDTTDALGISNILYVFNAVAFNNEILFAYKAHEKLLKSGVKPSVKNVLLGRGMDGLDITENLGDAGNILTSIIAGSRSGKGVVTLSILASLYADDCPVLYADFKPDMAVTLWDFERKLRAEGHENTRIFSIDALANQKSMGSQINPENGQREEVFSRPVRDVPFGYRLPSGMGISTSDMSVVPYLKTFQLVALMANLRANYGLGKQRKLFLVMDEAQKMNGAYVSLLEKMQRILSEQKPKKGAEKSETYLYAERFTDIFQKEMLEYVRAVAKTTGGSGLVGLILLGQTVEPGEWEFLGTWKNGPFGSMIANTNIKLIGRDSGTSPSYGRPTFQFPGSQFKEERGYFLKQRGSKVPTSAKDIQMIKTYLVLNDNDFNYEEYQKNGPNNDKFTDSLLNNITDEGLKTSIIEKDYMLPDGRKRESVGFMGLMKQIMGVEDGGDNTELARKMSLGYDLVNRVFTTMGLDQKYAHVEEYLYDCSIDSLYTEDQLLKMFLVGEGKLPSTVLADAEDGGFVSEDIIRENLDVLGIDYKTSKNQQAKLDTDDDDLDLDTPSVPPVPTSQTGGLNTDMDLDALASQYTTDANNAQEEGYSDVGDDELLGQDDSSSTVSMDASAFDNQFEEEEDITQPQPQPSMARTPRPEPYVQPQVPPQVPPQIDVHRSNGHTDTPINEQMHYSNVYQEPMNIDNNPFKTSRANGTLSTAYALKIISKQIVNQIAQMLGSLDRIETFEATSTGLVINGYAFRPQFDNEFIQSLPFDIQQDIARGNLTPLFNFDAVYDFKHMDTFIIDNTRLAEGRIKREMSLPNKLTWYKLLQRKKYLKRIIIGGQEITDRESCDLYENGGKSGYELQERLSEKLEVRPFRETPLGRLWQTTPARIATGALGATMGVKALGIGVALFGGWGLLFGSFAAYGAYRKYVKK